MRYPAVEELSVLKTADQIATCVDDLAATINRDYASRGELVVVGVLKGAFVFMSDLVRRLDLPISCDFIRVSSYGDQQVTSGVVKLELDLSQPVNGKHVLLVEDIVDTGLTLRYLRDSLHTRRPASVRTCALLHKREVSPDMELDYLGFTIPSEFVVGYGLDMAGRYRNLPFIGVVPPD
jgi:hypoxanthine phosphoribosyltransferase